MRKNTYILTGILALCMPLTGLAFSIETQDSVAGIGTEIEVTQLESTLDVEFSVTSEYGNELTLSVTPEDGSARVLVPGTELQESGTYTVFIEQGTEAQEATFSVLPDSIDVLNSSVQANTEFFTADNKSAADVYVIVRDQYGNPLTGRPIQLISSRSEDHITQFTSETDETGQQHFAVTTSTPGERTLRAIDLLSGNVLESSTTLIAEAIGGSVGGTAYYPSQRPMYGGGVQYPTTTYQQYQPTMYAPVQYNNPYTAQLTNGRRLYGQVGSFDIVDHFILQVPTVMQVNVHENLTITAVDRDNNVVEDYVGTVLLKSTDPNAVLPKFGEVEFRASDLGQKTHVLALQFSTPGDHILEAVDSSDPSVNGQVVITVMGGPGGVAQKNIRISNPREGAALSDEELTVRGEAPPFINLVVKGGIEDYYGESDAEGRFAIDIELDAEQTQHTIVVEEEQGRYESEEVHIELDAQPPEIAELTFKPEVGRAQENILAIVSVQETGSAIETVTMQIGESTYTLEKSISGEETYQTLFSIDQPGVYQPILTAVDDLGNSVQIRGTLEVQNQPVPIVKNLAVEIQDTTAVLTWDDVGHPDVDSYRVYVGESPDDFYDTLDTGRTKTTEKVGNLQRGTTYYFAVTALAGENESAKKSNTVDGTILGLDFNITSGDSQLMIEWTDINEQIPLLSYVFEYGVDPNELTEKRSLNGTQSAYILRDILNDVEYHFRLTPIATNGEVLEYLTAIGSGVPNGNGSIAVGQADPIPGGLDSLPGGFHGGAPRDPIPPIVNHPTIPQQPGSGIPGQWGWISMLALCIAGGAYVRHRHNIKRSSTFLHQMDSAYNTHQTTHQL